MRRLVVLTAAAVLFTTLSPVPTSYAAARRPDLTVSAVSAPAEVRAGATLAVKVSTRNTGRTRSAASTTKVYLSRDTRAGNDVVVGSVRVPRLAPRRTHTATVRLRVPAGTPARGYRVLACADAARRVRETKEGNNCRVASRAVTVTTAEVPDGTGFPKTPDPITVDPSVDESRAVSRQVNPYEDTSITATGADGTSYTLDIPAGALIGLEQVTLTPLSAVGGLPLSGGVAAGVELEPHGLVLLKQATLTIESPDLGPLAQQTPFYFHGGGEDFHLYPVLLPEPGDTADVVRLPIDHFSTPGIGLGTPGDRAGVLEHPPARDQAQVAGAISELLRGVREADPSGAEISTEVGAQMEAILNQYYDGSVKPRLAAAEQNPRNTAAAFASIDDALSWLRVMQLYLHGDEDADQTTRMRDAFDRAVRVFTAVYNDAWKRCSQEHELEMMPLLLRIARQAQLLGLAWGSAAEQRFKDCSRFEVRFDSRVTYAGTWPVGGENLYNYPHTGAGAWRAQATVISSLQENSGFGQASLPLTEASYHSEYSYPRSDGSTCHGSTDQTGSTPGTLRTTVIPSFPANPREVPPDGGWTPTPVDLLISVQPTGVLDIRRTVDCGGGDYTNTLTSEWLFTFRDFHPADLNLVYGKKDDRSADLMYAKTWNNSENEPNHLGGETWNETTTVEVWHKPAT